MENLKSQFYYEKGITFSPRINEVSRDMNRGVNKLYIWNDQKTNKQREIMQHE